MKNIFSGLTADFIIATLKEFGITTLFNYPGGTIAPLLNACHTYDIDIFTSISEQGAGFAAISQSKISKLPAVVAVTSGPGVTNLATCIADAYFDSVPLIAITGQVGTSDLTNDTHLRQKGFQEVNTPRLLDSICKKVFQPHAVEQVPAVLQDAFHCAMEGRKGPVVIDLPMDIQRATIEAYIPKLPAPTAVEAEKFARQEFLRNLLNEIKVSKSPLVICGSGALNLEYGVLKKLRDVIEHWNVPVSHSLLGLGAVDKKSLNLGFHGHTGNPVAGMAIHNADLVLVLGSRLDIRQTGNQFEAFAPSAKIFRVDIDSHEISHSRIPCQQSLLEDLSSIVIELWNHLEELIPPSLSNWHNTIQQWQTKLGYCYDDNGVSPKEIIKQTCEYPHSCNVIAVTGVGLHQHWVAREFHFSHPSRILLTSGGHGTMGYDLPSAIGAAYANPNATVLCFVGDGSLQMNIQELAVLAERNLNVKIIVFNNRRLGLVSQFQLQNWESDTACGNKAAVDFVAIANGYGISGESISHSGSVNSAIETAFARSGPYMLNFEISEQQDVIPMLLGGHKMDDMSY